MIDRATLKLLQTRMLPKLKELEAELGIKVDTWGGTFGNTDGSAVLKFRVARASKAAAPGDVDPGKLAFERQAPLYGFVASDFRRHLMHRGTRYRLVGFNSGAPKNACSIERVSDGKTFRGSIDLVRSGFAHCPVKVAA